MIERGRSIIIAMLFLWPASGNAIAKCDDGWMDYWPALVTLSGRMHKETVYGPPNYGEDPDTDAKETISILSLKNGINVRGGQDGDEPQKCESRVQLIFLSNLMALEATLNHKNITVQGELMHSQTGHHHTKVLMTIRAIISVSE